VLRKTRLAPSLLPQLNLDADVKDLAKDPASLVVLLDALVEVVPLSWLLMPDYWVAKTVDWLVPLSVASK
jgi:hypothetical protein